MHLKTCYGICWFSTPIWRYLKISDLSFFPWFFRKKSDIDNLLFNHFTQIWRKFRVAYEKVYEILQLPGNSDFSLHQCILLWIWLEDFEKNPCFFFKNVGFFKIKDFRKSESKNRVFQTSSEVNVFFRPAYVKLHEI